jgi:hypothetical protein
MSFKYTNHFLKKLEGLFATLEYTIRYEKGNFQSGYCIVENKKIAVINKFFDTEARINTLLDILSTVEVDVQTLDEKEAKLYQDLNKGDYLNREETEESSN